MSLFDILGMNEEPPKHTVHFLFKGKEYTTRAGSLFCGGFFVDENIQRTGDSGGYNNPPKYYIPDNAILYFDLDPSGRI